MNILNLSSVDYGGAGQMALQYNSFFEELGHDSYLIVKDSKSGIKLSVYNRGLAEKISMRKFKLKYRGLHLDRKYNFYNKMENSNIVSAKQILTMCPFKPDIIFLYWVSDFINAKAISDLVKLTGAKAYWMMVDNAPITGGCHYPWQCEGFKSNCGYCPAITSEIHNSLASEILSTKLAHLPSDLSLIVFSSSDFKRATSSALFGKKPILQHLGYVDETKYKPSHEKNASRQYWGISPGKKVLFLGATDLTDSRKGFDILIEAVNQLKEKQLLLLIAGNTDAKIFNHDCIITGYLDEGRLIKAYQAADVFICPSLEDSGPMMINQSIMCGTPVVAFNTGVAKDLIKESITGFLAKYKNANELRIALELFLQNDSSALERMNNNCRALGEQLYGKSATIKRFEEILKANNS